MRRPSSRGAELVEEPVQAEWVQYPGARPTVNLFVGSPCIASFYGNEFTDEDMPDAVRFGILWVHEEYRGAGTATRLVSALAHVAVRHHTTVMYGSVESPHVLRIFRRIMDDGAIHYLSGYPIREELPVTTDAAIQALIQLEADVPDLDWRDGITAQVDLTGLAIANLEQAFEVNEPLL